MDPSLAQSAIYFLPNRTNVAYLGDPGPPPYTTASLTANLMTRVTLSSLAMLICLVPLRVLHRNGELAATVLAPTVELLNLENILHALIWHNNDVWSWWAGPGYCDIVTHLHNAVNALFITCLLAIMRNLACQVGMMRASPLSAPERRRRNLVQAPIMFPLPILQLAWTVPAASRRYEVDALIGCTWAGHWSWPNMAFFVFPPVVVAVVTAGYAVVTYIHFRQIAKVTESALSSNRRANRRSQRTRRRLYMMVTSILVPYLPLVIAVAVGNVLEMPWMQPYNFDSIHYHATPMPWHVVLFSPSSEINLISLNNGYVNVLVAVPVFLFFGTTKDAINEYRGVALCFGFGLLFPRLRNEYDSDRTPCSEPSTSSSYGTSQGLGHFKSSFASHASSSSADMSRNRDFPSKTLGSSRRSKTRRLGMALVGPRRRFYETALLSWTPPSVETHIPFARASTFHYRPAFFT